ncbi:hypothetical protein [Hungatella sp.]|uniref:hypothetical protein n=1 Tax=Hungatella sp. TaxID=2613924 RepID=UPI00290358FB|nr:hypothetical protein [Hungatella hathewayi]
MKSKTFSGYQRDFAKALLVKPEYTMEEAKKVLDNFFGKEGINDGRRNLDKPE